MYVKCSEDSERIKRKSPFSTTTLSFDAPSPSNPREYLHKPYTARNYVAWATFLSLTVYGYSSASFRAVLSESRRRQTISCRARTDFNAKWSFKVTQGHLFRYQWRVSLLMGYVAKYNKYGLRCEGSEDIANERSENRHFWPPYSHLTHPSIEPPRISA